MEIIGYSERGVVNSLFYEIKYKIKVSSNLSLLSDFLSLIRFPNNKNKIDWQKISGAKILIEQSFSDFGDADVVILVDSQNNKKAIFIEAKVKTSQRESWSIEDEFENFTKLINENNNSSNLFTQLYYKTRLVQGLQKGKDLEKGLYFPGFKKEWKKIGKNKIVKKAVEQLKEYSKEALFVALVPDKLKNLKNFYENKLKDFKPQKIKDWDVRNWGYLSWQQVYEFCQNKLEETEKIFEWNEGQIFDISKQK